MLHQCYCAGHHWRPKRHWQCAGLLQSLPVPISSGQHHLAWRPVSSGHCPGTAAHHDCQAQTRYICPDSSVLSLSLSFSLSLSSDLTQACPHAVPVTRLFQYGSRLVCVAVPRALLDVTASRSHSKRMQSSQKEASKECLEVSTAQSHVSTWDRASPVPGGTLSMHHKHVNMLFAWPLLLLLQTNMKAHGKIMLGEIFCEVCCRGLL